MTLRAQKIIGTARFRGDPSVRVDLLARAVDYGVRGDLYVIEGPLDKATLWGDELLDIAFALPLPISTQDFRV